MDDWHSNPVLVVDSDCALCNWAVRFIMKHERKPELLFSANNSMYSKDIFLSNSIKGTENESVVLIYENKFYLRSEAVFRVLAVLKPPFSWLRVFGILPRSITDFFYGIVATNRKRWFGSADFCAYEAGVDKKRFLD
jgi:predicted DCC family thiol-disulfide oxidoreductase YuxK